MRSIYNSKLGIIEKKEIEKYKKIWISQDTLILHIKRKNVLLTFKTINMWHQMALLAKWYCCSNRSELSFVHKYTELLYLIKGVPEYLIPFEIHMNYIIIGQNL